MNVKSDKFYVNGQTSSNSNLNSRWNFVIKVGCFEISFMCRTHSWYSHFFIFGISGKSQFFLNLCQAAILPLIQHEIIIVLTSVTYTMVSRTAVVLRV